MFSPGLDCEHAERAIAKDQRRSTARREIGTSKTRIFTPAIINDDSFPRRERLTNRIACKRNDFIGNTFPVVFGKIKRRDTQFVFRLILKRQRSRFVRHDRTHRRRDRREQLAQIQIRHERVVDLQEQLRTIAFARDLLSLEL